MEGNMSHAEFDATDFLNKSAQYITARLQKINRAVHDVADEILRLSSFEVPHDTGMLQSSGHVEGTHEPDEVIVGYNKVYAARLHEHPEYRFQKGRKGKYLEDPIKKNKNVFIKHIQKAMQEK